MILFLRLSFKSTGSICDRASIKIFTFAAMVIFHNPFEIAFMVPLTLRGYGFLLVFFFKGGSTVFDFLQYCLKDEDVKMDDS